MWSINWNLGQRCLIENDKHLVIIEWLLTDELTDESNECVVYQDFIDTKIILR